MSHLNEVLRRSIAHLDPSDRAGRERVFADARERMIRLLSAYLPPLTAAAIEAKIDEFDATTRAIHSDIEAEQILARRPSPRFTPPPPAVGAPTPVAARDVPRATPPSQPRPEPAPYRPAPPPAEAADYDDGEDEPYDEEEDRYAAEDFEDCPPSEGEAPEDYDPDSYYEDDGYDEEVDERRSFLDRVPFRAILLTLIGLVLLGVAAAGGFYLYRRAQTATPPAATSEAPAAVESGGALAAAPDGSAPPGNETTSNEAPGGPAPNAGTVVASSEVKPLPASPTPTSPATTPTEAAAPPPPPMPTDETPAHPAAIETLVLFDGRDPSAFQSSPDNPVRFQGDTEGGFAEIGSSTGSTGARLLVGRGVYERIAGRTIRVVVTARASRETPASMMRFAYQNGRNVSPWSDLPLHSTYAPLVMTWSVPKDRGGPDRDVLIIEPGIPGDETAADIRSVKIEVLS